MNYTGKLTNNKMIWALLISLALATNDYQANTIRELLRNANAPVYVRVIDGVQNGTYAFTESDRRSIYIDMKRFECCPKTFINVMNHEIEHTKGRDHTSIIGDIMNYSMKIDLFGNVIDDLYIWAI